MRYNKRDKYVQTSPGENNKGDTDRGKDHKRNNSCKRYQDWHISNRFSKCVYDVSQKWIDTTQAIGIISKSGRYGGTFAHYIKRKADLDDRLYRMYDKIKNVETRLIEARAKKQAVETEKLTGDNIYKVLLYFEKLYAAMKSISSSF